ncbi:hypothetical protein DSH74_14000 [Enterococcus faecium]|nr:hypothetical protein EA467_13630 [Enterococcus faecium]EPI14162.1 hypothetical protein D357_00015 [Enterococcus faecium SD3B-2]RAX29761.1 hypothetical protein DQE80_13005 [Enterococcus sp. HPCN18]EGP5223885.1 hypothetical protein [Enterococcus faecium]EGP5312861.1 hypothetical protein [Enterococcus faecium]
MIINTIFPMFLKKYNIFMTNLYLFQSKTDETLIDKFKWIVWLYQQLFKLAGFESKLEVYY